eukprot:1548435-Rhodomonas_salina.1
MHPPSPNLKSLVFRRFGCWALLVQSSAWEVGQLHANALTRVGWQHWKADGVAGAYHRARLDDHVVCALRLLPVSVSAPQTSTMPLSADGPF